MGNSRSGRTFARSAGALLVAGVLAGCQTPNAGVIEPVVTPLTEQSFTLRNMPAPTKRIPVAVYEFPDLTGQFRERNVQTMSRAVTQGGAPMLIKALQDAGERHWFSVLDRARLDDVLKERQIVTEMRRTYRGEERIDPAVLAPLNHAGIIMQGGIVGFDTNTMTGGAGARYLGIGGDGKWQQDTVSISLRAVSTDTGEVLASVMVHKMVASYSLQGGAFRYVALDRLLELEAGITQNEPKQIAVQQGIEKAVASLIVEGAELGVWSFANEKAGREVISAYREEKYGDHMGEVAQIVPRPETRNATKAVPTAPLPQQARQQQAPAQQPAPAQQQRAPARETAPAEPESPPPPPAPDEDEVLGRAGEDPGSPPEPAAGEVVGSIDAPDREAADAPAPSSNPDGAAGPEDTPDVIVAGAGNGFSPQNAPQPYRGLD